MSSVTFQKRIKSGRYIFADSCFCLNTPDYIQYDEDGRAMLTPYAIDHMDECCLVFTYGIVGSWACDQGSGDTPISFITSMPLCTPPRYFDDEEKAQRHIESFKKIRDEVKSVEESLPRTFSGSLDELIRWRGVDECDLAHAVDLSTKTIHRLRTDETYETVVKLCIGLQLHPILSGHLLSTAGILFRPKEPDIPTKSGKARLITVAPSVMAALKRQKVKQAEAQLCAGPAWKNKEGFVFTNGLGGHLAHFTVYKEFKKIVCSIGLGDARFHDLRHPNVKHRTQNFSTFLETF